MSVSFPMAEATGNLGPQNWLVAPSTRAVIAALTADGTEVRFVGGCVRDAIVNRPISDIDIATPDLPQRVIKLLEAAGIKAIPTGIGHGTITAIADGMVFEVTTLRVDVSTDGRRAEVAFTDDWIADALRRDFTINTFSATPDGEFFDPFNSFSDLSCGQIRFVGNPTTRIEEDVLRILRFFRFYAHYGRLPLSVEALAACRMHAALLPSLSGERVRGELLRILAAPDPANILMLMHGVGVLHQILPEVGEHAGHIGHLRVLQWLDTTGLYQKSVCLDPLRRLAVVLDTDALGVAAASERLRLSRADAARLAALAVPECYIAPGMDENNLRRSFYSLGPDRVRDLALISWAGERAANETPALARTGSWEAILEAAEAWKPIEFPLKGRDAIALGMTQGPSMGKALANVETWWQDGGCRFSRNECLVRLAAEVASTS
ncbi:MAG: CCA tRNA nucleotidyltransferase [Rhodospirillales bacterium]